MASVTVQKWGTAAACRGQCIHIYREGKSYGNPDIDQDKAGRVWVIGTAKECQKSIRETIAKIDKNRPPKRVKRDRKTVAELCVPAPREGTSQEDAMRFFAAVYDELDAAATTSAAGRCMAMRRMITSTRMISSSTAAAYTCTSCSFRKPKS
jgi:hypothetical protein